MIIKKVEDNTIVDAIPTTSPIIKSKDTTEAKPEVVVEEMATPEKPEEKVEAPKAQSIEKITDSFEIHNLMSQYTPTITKRIPIISQGIFVETETLLLSDLYTIANSDNGRIKALSMVFEKLTKASKEAFTNDFGTFLKSVSIYDIDMFYAAHAESFGEEEFVFTCENSDCEKEVEFKSKMRDLRHTSDMLTTRIEDILSGKDVPFIDLAKDNLIKINDQISFRVGLCSLEKYKSLVERKNLSGIIYKTLLQLEAIVFTQVNKEVVYSARLLPEIINMLEKIPLPKNYMKSEMDVFEDINISFEAKIKCPHCGHINHKFKNDLLGDLIKKVVA